MDLFFRGYSDLCETKAVLVSLSSISLAAAQRLRSAITIVTLRKLYETAEKSRIRKKGKMVTVTLFRTANAIHNLMTTL